MSENVWRQDPRPFSGKFPFLDQLMNRPLGRVATIPLLFKAMDKICGVDYFVGDGGRNLTAFVLHHVHFRRDSLFSCSDEVGSGQRTSGRCVQPRSGSGRSRS